MGIKLTDYSLLCNFLIVRYSCVVKQKNTTYTPKDTRNTGGFDIIVYGFTNFLSTIMWNSKVS